MAQGTQETESVRNLLEMAETKAKGVGDVSKFDFVEYLENGGVLMPRDKVTVFTDSRSSAEILALYRKHDAILKEVSARAEAERQIACDLRYRELYPEVSKTWAQDDDDFSMVGEDDAPTKEAGQQALWSRVFEEIPSPTVAEVPEAVEYMNAVEPLEKAVWESRILLDMEGMQPGAQRAVEQDITDELTKKYQMALSPEMRQEYANARRADETVAACITRLQIPAKGIDQDFSKERMPASVARRFLQSLTQDQVDKVMQCAQMLSTVAVIVEPTVDAGFPGGSSESAGE